MAGIQDVAKKAGVSQSTVSYVLSGRRPISDATRAKVLHAIEELNYQPHAGARALASSRTQVLGLVSPLRPGVDVNVIMQFAAGIATRARHYDHDVLLVTERDASGIESMSRRSMVDGFIVMDVESRDTRIETLMALRQPSVLIGLPEDPGSLSCIDFDFDAAGAMAIRQLATNGHQRTAVISSPPEVHTRGTSYAVRLAAGVEREAQRRGISVETFASSADPAETNAMLDRLITDGVTGLIVHNESALPGVVTDITSRGADVMERTQIVAIGPKALMFAPQLNFTVIDIPGTAIGANAVDMLMDRLEHDALPERRLVAPRVD